MPMEDGNRITDLMCAFRGLPDSNLKLFASFA